MRRRVAVLARSSGRPAATPQIFRDSAGEIRPDCDSHENPECAGYQDCKTQGPWPRPLRLAIASSPDGPFRGVSARIRQVLFGCFRWLRPARSLGHHRVSMAVMRGISVTQGGQLLGSLSEFAAAHNATLCVHFLCKPPPRGRGAVGRRALFRTAGFSHTPMANTTSQEGGE